MLCAGEGGCYLRGLLETPLENTGFTLPSKLVRMPVAASLAATDEVEYVETLVSVNGVLGLGGTSTVFSAIVGGQPCAIKIPLSADATGVLVKLERAALKRLAAASVHGVPHIVCDAVDEGVIITAPVGRPIAVSSLNVHSALNAHRSGTGGLGTTLPRLVDSSLCRSILMTLRDMHVAGVIQGDMRLSNIVAAVGDPRAGVQRSLSAAPPSASASSGGSASSVHPASRSAVVIDFGSAFISKRSPSTKQWRFRRVLPAKWISLPYAHPDVLRAFATNRRYRPAPCHDLFMFGASLHRLLVPWAPCWEVNTTADAENLARYWELLMAPAMPVATSATGLGGDEVALSVSAFEDAPAVSGHKKRRLDVPTAAGGGSSGRAASARSGTALEATDDADDSSITSAGSPRLGTVSPWGILFTAAVTYDLVAFEVAAGNAVRSVVPDWPW